MASKLSVPAVALVFAATGVQTAAAFESKNYARLDVGTSVASELDLDVTAPIAQSADLSGDQISLAVGRQFDPTFRVELEASHRVLDADNAPDLSRGEVELSALMLNAFADASPVMGITPYAGLGIGVVRVGVRASSELALVPVRLDSSNYSLGYQVMLGASAPLADRVRLDVAYRYFGGGSVEGRFDAPPAINQPFSAEVANQAITLGLRYVF